ncbi:MAG TPA: acyl-CoA synthetase [Porticoccaceae bacterium]|nr:acyl-CoA synthetase [Porticoccaceae bacterium]
MNLHEIPFRDVSFPSAKMDVVTRADGTLLIESMTKLQDYIANLPKILADQAQTLASKPYLKQRNAEGSWVSVSYAEMFRDSSAVAEWLIRQRFDSGRPMLILSGNSILHAVFKYGAMAAKVPVCPVSFNYATLGGDYVRLKHVVRLLSPVVIFAEQTNKFKAALESVDFGDAIIVTSSPEGISRNSIAIDIVLQTHVTSAVRGSIDSIDPDATSVLMLTSGSTSLPKAVIQTQRMITSNLAQGCQVLGETAGWDDVMLDWLPWNHVSGAFTKMGVMISGGTLYIDGGRPIPGEFQTTIKNLKDVPVRFFTNVPAGYAMLADAMDEDLDLRRIFFSKLRLALYGGAGLSQSLYDRLQSMAIEETNKRVFFTTGYGATETSSGCMAIYFESEEVGVGLPMPGLTIKLIPTDGRYEIRMKGPMMTPGYIGHLVEGLYDEESFLRVGDYVDFIVPGNIHRGLKFAGRVAEEFKLSTGTWVSGGHLRAQLVQVLWPIVSDALICGINDDYVGALMWINRSAAEKVIGTPLPITAEGLANMPELRGIIHRTLSNHNTNNPGVSTRFARVTFLMEPPSIDAQEISDKGTINQAIALQRRADDVARIYSKNPDDSVIILE